MGTYSQYVARLDLDTGAIRRYGNPTGGGPGHAVFAVLASRSAVWVGTDAGLDRLDPGTGHRTRMLDLPVRVLAGQPQALLRDPRGALWYATAAGLYRIDPDGAPPVRVGSAGALHALLRDRSGRLWAGGDAGLFLVSDRSALVPVWPRAGSPGGDVRALAEAPDGHLWMAIANAGLRRFDPSSGQTQALRQDPALPDALTEGE